MGISVYPIPSSGGLSSAIKSLQTGSASSSGNITISSVNTSKAVVQSFPTGASGTVAVSGGVNGQNIGLNAANGGVYGLNPQTFALGTNAVNNTYMTRYGNNGTNFNSGINYFSPVNIGNNAPSLYIGLLWNNNDISSNADNAGGVYTPVNNNAANGSTSGGNFNSGSNNLYAAQYGAYLTNGTTLTVTGPCQWQVVEYN